jgi:nucleoside 2-deoxyribosyltransferase
MNGKAVHILLLGGDRTRRIALGKLYEMLRDASCLERPEDEHQSDDGNKHCERARRERLNGHGRPLQVDLGGGSSDKAEHHEHRTQERCLTHLKATSLLTFGCLLIEQSPELSNLAGIRYGGSHGPLSDDQLKPHPGGGGTVERSASSRRLVAVSDPPERPRCYVASPLGFHEAGRVYYRDVYLPALATVVEPVDPWTLTTPGQIEEAKRAGTLRDTLLAAGRRNAAAICSSAFIAAFLDGQELDSGTVAEVGYGAGLGKRCFGLRTDLRQAGEEGMTVNLQVETFVVDSGGEIAATLEDLVEALGLAAKAIAPRPNFV